MEVLSSHNPVVFQTDSPLVLDVYNNADNFLIEYNQEVNSNICAIYFSSNNIYYPNKPEVFEKAIVKGNRYEWFGTRVTYARKHIFIRDIQKQWYLTGINANYNTPDKLIQLLKQETEGYTVVTLGSSAGGFAAVLFGSLLAADTIISFNGQFELNSLLNTSTEDIDPILFRYRKQNKLTEYYDIVNFIQQPSNIFYFYSNKSKWDCEQKDHAAQKKINIISFDTDHHGIPFLKNNLPVILSSSKAELVKLANKKYHPLFFSVKIVGIIKTISGVYQQVMKKR